MHILMEYCAGGSVAQLLRAFGALTEVTAASYTQQVLTGLAYIHDNGIMHRDIKGANLLLTIDGVCKLGDFGAATVIEAQGEATGDVSVVGTPNWMAPEVISQLGHSEKADIWSLCCSVMEMLTAQAPWIHVSAQSLAVLAFLVGGADVIPVARKGLEPTNLSDDAVVFVTAGLVRDPAQRPTARKLSELPWVNAGNLSQMASDPTNRARLMSMVEHGRARAASVYRGGPPNPPPGLTLGSLRPPNVSLANPNTDSVRPPLQLAAGADNSLRPGQLPTGSPSGSPAARLRVDLCASQPMMNSVPMCASAYVPSEPPRVADTRAPPGAGAAAPSQRRHRRQRRDPTSARRPERLPRAHRTWARRTDDCGRRLLTRAARGRAAARRAAFGARTAAPTRRGPPPPPHGGWGPSFPQFFSRDL